MNRKEFLHIAVVFLGSELLGCGTTGSGGSGGGSGSTGGGGGGTGGSTGGGSGSSGGGTGAQACTSAITASSVASLSTLGALESGIEAAHEHHLTIPLADILADQAQSYIHGVTGVHTHSIQLTPDQFTQLLNGQSVTTTVFNSTGDAAHTHSVKLVCG